MSTKILQIIGVAGMLAGTSAQGAPIACPAPEELRFQKGYGTMNRIEMTREEALEVSDPLRGMEWHVTAPHASARPYGWDGRFSTTNVDPDEPAPHASPAKNLRVDPFYGYHPSGPLVVLACDYSVGDTTFTLRRTFPTKNGSCVVEGGAFVCSDLPAADK